MKKLILVLFTMLSLFLISIDRIYADSHADIKIDGQFNDWDHINKAQVGYYNMGSWTMVVSEDTLSFYIDNGNNSNISIPDKNYTLKVGNRSYDLEFNNSDGQVSVTARDINDSWRSLGNVGTGIIKKDGSKQTGEFSVPLMKLGISTANAAETTLNNPNLGPQTVTATASQINSSSSDSSNASSSSSANSSSSSSSNSNSSSASETSSSNSAEGSSTPQDSASSSSSQASPNNQTNNLGISIDGNFNDWSDKPKAPMKIEGDDDNIKYVSLLADDKNIYFYIEMRPVLSGGYVNFQPSGYELTVGNAKYFLDLNKNKTVELNEGQVKLVTLGIYNSKTDKYEKLDDHVAVTKKKITQKMGDGSTVTGEGYLFECAVPLSELKESSNMPGQTIALANKNLWTGQVNASGGSTKPIILAVVGLLIAIFSAYKYGNCKSKSWRNNTK